MDYNRVIVNYAHISFSGQEILKVKVYKRFGRLKAILIETRKDKHDQLAQCNAIQMALERTR